MDCCVQSAGRAMMGCPVTDPRKEALLQLDKVSWQQVGHVAEPGRYMFRFGWLTIAPDDLAIWTQFPNASFTLVQTLAPPSADDVEATETPATETREFHLGAFELHTNDDFGEQHAAA
jgi:hypothetical protein